MATINAINNTCPSGITVSGGAVSINSGTSSFNLSNDASATTVNLGTGAAAKTVTIGSTTTTSLLALQYGTADFTLASATGTVMSALDTGEIIYPLQPAFHAYLGTQDSNVTGDNTQFILGTGNALTELYDQNSDFNTNGTFTAPVSGKYAFGATFQYLQTAGTFFYQQIVTTAVTFTATQLSATVAITNIITISCYVECAMTAGDTAKFATAFLGGAKITDIAAGSGTTFCYGHLIC